jgi:hypothetical protein
MSPAKKAAAPVKRATKTPRAASRPANAEPAPVAIKPQTTTFLGREVEVKTPTPDQLFAWNELIEEWQSLDAAEMTVEQTLALVGDFVEIINSVLPSDADRAWYRKGRIRGTITLEASATLVLDVMKTYKDELADAEPTNRAARRAKA